MWKYVGNAHEQPLHVSLHRLMVKHSRNALALHRPDGRYVYINPAYTRLTGYTLAELSMFSLEMLIHLVHPDDCQAAQECHQSMLDEFTTTSSEYRLRRKDGSYVWVETVTTRICGAGGRVRYLLASTRDITERRQIQQQAFQAALEHERAQLMTCFIRDAAHEFRTPLAIINTEAYLMARQPNTEKRVLKAQQIEAQIARTSRLLDMLLFMVRLDNEEMQASFSRISLAAVLQRAYGRVYARYADRPARLELAPDLPLILGSATDLEEACVQVIDNAYRYSSDDSTVHIRLLQDGSSLVLQVEDKGNGIAEEDQAHIFETFWRKDAARTSSGFGLGLTIASRIMDYHGGMIRLRSVLGQGSTFCLILPLPDLDEG